MQIDMISHVKISCSECVCGSRVLSIIRNLLDPSGKYRHQPGDPRLQVRMDITNKCNLLCRMCHYRNTASEPKYDMEPDLFRKIVREIFPFTEWAALSCQYEAFMSRHIEEILASLVDSPCKQIGIVTNATLWNERRIGLVLENPAIAAVSVSIDGGTKETFERIRINGNWDKLVRNLELFERMRSQRGTGRPELRFNTVLMKSTVLELPKLIELAKRSGAMRVEALRYVPVNGFLDEEITDWVSVMPALIRAKQLCHDAGMEIYLPLQDPRLDSIRDSGREAICNEAHVGRFSTFCEAPWNAVQIYPNGDVYPCLYFGKCFGNLRQQSFLEIWNSQPYLELRRSLVRRQLQAPCEMCNPHGYDNVEHKALINTKKR